MICRPSEDGKGLRPVEGILFSLVAILLLMFTGSLYYAVWALYDLGSRLELLLLSLALNSDVLNHLYYWYVYFCCSGILLFLVSLPMVLPCGKMSEIRGYLAVLFGSTVLVLVGAPGLLVCSSNIAVLEGRLETELTPGLRSVITEHPYYRPQAAPSGDLETTLIGGALDFLQTNGTGCCGSDGSAAFDYREADFVGRYNLTLPYSCCTLGQAHSSPADRSNVGPKDVQSVDRCMQGDPAYMHHGGCAQRFQQNMELFLKEAREESLVIGWIAVAMSVILFIFIPYKCIQGQGNGNRSRSSDVTAKEKLMNGASTPRSGSGPDSDPISSV